MPFGGGGSPGGTNAGLLLPPGQSQVAGQLLPLVQPMANQAQGSLATIDQFGGAPASLAYPGTVQSYNQILNNPYFGQALGGAQTGADIYTNQYSPYASTVAPSELAIGKAAQDVSGQALATGFNPQYQVASAFGNNLNALVNPYLPQILSQGFDPRYQTEIGNAQAESQLLNRAGAQLVDTGFDPQNQLYDRTQQRILDQTQAANAASGVASTPYGAGVTGDVLKNFNIDWQNQQLQRELAGAQGASGAFGQARALPQNALNQALTAGITGGQGASTIGNEILGSVLTPLNNASAAALQGSSAYGNLANTAMGAYGGSLGTLGQDIGLASQSQALPYNTLNTQAGNVFGGAQNLTNIGNAQYLLPQQVIGDLFQYLGLGQNASTIANQIGSTNFNQANQLGQGLLGAAGQGANLLGGSGGLGSLFGGGAGSFGDLAAANAATNASIADVAAGGLGAADVGGGSAAFAPLAFLGS